MPVPAVKSSSLPRLGFGGSRGPLPLGHHRGLARTDGPLSNSHGRPLTVDLRHVARTWPVTLKRSRSLLRAAMAMTASLLVAEAVRLGLANGVMLQSFLGWRILASIPAAICFGCRAVVGRHQARLPGRRSCPGASRVSSGFPRRATGCDPVQCACIRHCRGEGDARDVVLRSRSALALAASRESRRSTHRHGQLWHVPGVRGAVLPRVESPGHDHVQSGALDLGSAGHRRLAGESA